LGLPPKLGTGMCDLFMETGLWFCNYYVYI
jgi:hypothetical protein